MNFKKFLIFSKKNAKNTKFKLKTKFQLRYCDVIFYGMAVIVGE